jgi:hypothetical protein
MRGGYDDPERCVCPRSLALATRDQESVRAFRKRRGRFFAWGSNTSIPEVRALHGHDLTSMPDLSSGACTRPENIATMDAAYSREASERGMLSRAQAEIVCASCPLSTLKNCRKWVLENEEIPGSWGGVWGGLDPWKRTGRQLIVKDGFAQARPFEIGGPDDLLQS